MTELIRFLMVRIAGPPCRSRLKNVDALDGRYLLWSDRDVLRATELSREI
jgi:hypothetical protein